MNAQDALSEIYNFRMIGQLGTAGQPSRDQFPLLREAGFDAVVNLALPTSDNAIPDEGSIVTGLGMSYLHVPVNFQKPAVEDFRTFCGVMKVLEDRHVFVHCAANMRVSVFVFLYRILHQNAARTVAEKDLQAIWQPDEVWDAFLQQRLLEAGLDKMNSSR
jgi:protein tyrosine phosphatase (PTP) superfamily phosphohydrolase (DUF442 family)